VDDDLGPNFLQDVLTGYAAIAVLVGLVLMVTLLLSLSRPVRRGNSDDSEDA
jgi:hypothetical protein